MTPRAELTAHLVAVLYAHEPRLSSAQDMAGAINDALATVCQMSSTVTVRLKRGSVLQIVNKSDVFDRAHDYVREHPGALAREVAIDVYGDASSANQNRARAVLSMLLKQRRVKRVARGQWEAT